MGTAHVGDWLRSESAAAFTLCLARLSACGHGTGPPLPVPATCTARLPAKPDAAGPPRVVRPAYAADAVWPRATCFPRAGRHHKPGLHHGASRTHGAVQPALDKTENSITVLGRNVQQNRHPGIPESAASMMAMLRYGSRFPWNRLESLENSLGIPLPAATQCQIMAETAAADAPKRITRISATAFRTSRGRAARTTRLSTATPRVIARKGASSAAYCGK